MNRTPFPQTQLSESEPLGPGQQLCDRLNRPLRTLRVSVTDRCNFRCSYCMPNEKERTYRFFKKAEALSTGEFLRLIKIFVGLGVEKIRLTGGEPLLYPHLTNLVHRINRIPGVQDLALTTNGSLLAQHAFALKNSGLHRLTISLDTLNKDLFQRIRGSRNGLQNTLAGIKTAQEAGFSPIKINAVIQRGINENNILELVEFFRGTPHILRFIETMDAGNCSNWQPEMVVPNSEILKQLRAHFSLIEIPRESSGDVAQRYRFIDSKGEGEVGFISAITQPFCQDCNRMRLSSDGKIYSCLFASQGVDLREPLRTGASDDELRQIISRTWNERTEKYSEDRWLFRALKENIKKVEMHRIGG